MRCPERLASRHGRLAALIAVLVCSTVLLIAAAPVRRAPAPRRPAPTARPHLPAEKRQLVDLGEGRIACWTQGAAGPSIVFVSALAEDSRSWARLAAALATRARLLRYDRPGLGASDAGVEPRSATRIALELHNLVNRIEQPRPFVLVAHGEGAWYALRYASLYRSDVRAIVLVDPTPFGFYEEAALLMNDSERRQYEAARTARMNSPGPREEWDAKGQAEREAKRSPLDKSIPVAVVSAKSGSPWTSTAVRKRWLDRQRQWISSWRIHRLMVVDSGHDVPVQNPAAVTTAIEWAVTASAAR